MKAINKTVSYKGENIKVLFRTANFHRNVISKDAYGRIKLANGSRDFIINEKVYSVGFEVVLNKKHNVTHNFEGVYFPDNEKKVIEYIISKYGL